MAEKTPEHAIEMIERYATAATDSDVEGIVACFAEDAELRDPFDGRSSPGGKRSVSSSPWVSR